ncbi:unnamed protein product, partial [Hapterophycus canaliculatus]
ESRRGRGSTLPQAASVQRRGVTSKSGFVVRGANSHHAGGGGGSGGGSSGSSFKSSAREDYLRKILQSRHPFPPHFHMLLYFDRSYLYYRPCTGDRVVLPVDAFGPRTPPPAFKQLRVHPDGGMGPIPLYTGWTLGPVPTHVAAWATAAKRVSADSDSLAQSGRPRSLTRGEGGVAEAAPGGFAAAGLEAAAAAAAAAAAGGTGQERGDVVLGSITAGQPGARLPLVPEPDETFVSRDTGVTASGLPRLLRPLQWQHLHVPLLTMSCRHVLKQAIDVKEPFLMGTYTSVLERRVDSTCRETLTRPGQGHATNSAGTGGGVGGGAGRGWKGDGNLSPPPSDAQNSSGGGGSSNIPPAALYTAHALSEGGQRHVTIADLSQGVIYPSKALELAAACTIGLSLDVDTDSEMRSLIFSHFRGTQGNRAAADRSRTTGWGWPGGGSGAGPVDPGDYDTDEANASMAMLPAIPCRQALYRTAALFRYQLANRLEKQGEGTGGGSRQDDGTTGYLKGTKAKAKPYGGSGAGGVEAGGGAAGGVDRAAMVTRLLQTPVYSANESKADGGGREDALVASRTGEALRLFLFRMMVHFFKGYHIFIRPPDSPSGEDDYLDEAAGGAAAGGSAAAVGRSGGGVGGSGGGGGRAGQGHEADVEFDVLGFLSFAKADLRPFLRALLRTKAFAVFLADARGWSPSSTAANASSGMAGVSSSRGDQRDETLSVRRRKDEAVPQRGQRQPLSRSRERRAASTTDIYGRRSSGSGGVSTAGGDEKGSGSRHPSGTSSGGDGFRLNLERAITTRMQEQLQVHSAVGTERMGAYLLTYFTHSQHVAPQPSWVDMGYGFGQGSIGGPLSPNGGGGGGGGGGGISRAAMALRARANGAPKVRRRWCVLDATRLTLFRSRSKTKVKDRVQL